MLPLYFKKSLLTQLIIIIFFVINKFISKSATDFMYCSRGGQSTGVKALHAMFMFYCSCLHSGFGEELQLFPRTELNYL